MYAAEVQVPEWRLENSEGGGRSRRVLSIEEMRKRLGVAAPAEVTERPAKTEPEVRTPPRIIRRKELIAAC